MVDRPFGLYVLRQCFLSKAVAWPVVDTVTE